MIIKLVSNIDLRRSIEEVLSTVPIISQATFNKSTVNWEECTPPYAVDKRAFQNHTRGKKKGHTRDSDPNICTVGERIALSRATKKVLKAFVGIGTLEQQQLILLRVLSDPSFQNISSSIGINNRAVDDLTAVGGGNRLYWVLPPLYFKSFTWKPAHGLEQYAIKIPYPE